MEEIMEKVIKVIDFIKSKWQYFSIGFMLLFNIILIVVIVNLSNNHTILEASLKEDIKELNSTISSLKVEKVKLEARSKLYETQAQLYAKLAEGKNKKVNQIIYETNKDISTIDSMSIDELISEFTKQSNNYKSGLFSQDTI